MAMRHIESKEGAGQFTNDPDKEKARLARRLITAAQAWRQTYGDIPFPSVATPKPRGLEPIRHAIEIPRVSEELYNRTREAVEQAGYNFIVPIRSVSIEELLEEDNKRGQRRFNHDWVSCSKTTRTTVPPEMEVFINPDAVRIEGSNCLSTDDQEKKIAEAAASFKEQLPEGVRSFVDLHVVDPSTISQLEDAWMDAGNGFLLPNYFARTAVRTPEDRVAHVGRYGPDDQRRVPDWHRNNAISLVFAVPVGVLPKKLAG